MDKEHARFILRSFRADGADAADPEFANALQLAMQDRDLGEWLANERSNDAAFSAALHEIPLPETLRNEILDALAWQRGDLSHAEAPEDQSWTLALEKVTPPADLRANILAAMQACVRSAPAPTPIWKKYGIPAAAAAAVALALTIPSAFFKPDATFVTVAPGFSDQDANGPAPLPVEIVRAGFIDIYQSPDFTLESGRGSHQEIMSRLQERGLPCPSCIPPGLREIEGIGCREIIIDGRRGAVVCYKRDEDGYVHLVIFRAEDIQDALPYRREALFAQHGEWAAAAWRNNENAFFLLGHTDVNQIASLF